MLSKKPEPEVIDYVPRGSEHARPARSGAGGRFARLCLCLGLPFILFGFWRLSHGVDGGDPSASLFFWAVGLAFVVPALLTVAASWVRTGRAW
jgi:hypothetical protein